MAPPQHHGDISTAPTGPPVTGDTAGCGLARVTSRHRRRSPMGVRSMRRRGAGPGRRGQSLIGTVARTAVIAGTASAVVGRVASHRARTHQQQEQADEQAEAAPTENQAAQAQAAADATAPVGGLSAESIARLQQLGDLLKQGILTDEEFAAQKAKVLGT